MSKVNNMESHGSCNNAQSEVISAQITILDNTGTPSKIVERGKDWYVLLNLDFKYLPEGSYSIGLKIYLETIGTDSSEPAWSGEQECMPEKLHYEFRAPIKEHSVAEGIYRTTAIVGIRNMMKDTIFVSFWESDIIQVYSAL
jgi:hypothetical protein